MTEETTQQNGNIGTGVVPTSVGNRSRIRTFHENHYVRVRKETGRRAALVVGKDNSCLSNLGKLPRTATISNPHHVAGHLSKNGAKGLYHLAVIGWDRGSDQRIQRLVAELQERGLAVIGCSDLPERRAKLLGFGCLIAADVATCATMIEELAAVC